MAIVNKIKLPNSETRDIGALSSNIIYNGDSGITTTLNDKIQSIMTGLANKSGFETATTTTAGLMSAQDKKDLDRLKISGSTPVTISGDDSIEVQDASEDKKLFKLGNKIWIQGDNNLTDCLYVINTSVEQSVYKDNSFTFEVEVV